MNSTSSVSFAIEFMNASNELFAEVDQAMVKYVGRTVSWPKKWTLFTRRSYAKSYTQYNTKWAREIFEDWQQNRSNKNAQVESVGYEGVNWSQGEEDLNIRHVTLQLSKFTLQLELLAV